MAKRITEAQLIRAFATTPQAVMREGKIFLQRGLSEYKRVAIQTSPWRVGQSGGGIPVKTGDLKEQHRTVINGLEGRFGVGDKRIPYAEYVHGGTPGGQMKSRPWLDFARMRANSSVEKHYKAFMNNILAHIAA